MVRTAAARAAMCAALAVPPADACADEQRSQVEQRVALSARLLSDTASIRRIEASGVREAQAHLDNARVHQALAIDALQRADLAAARRDADEALRLVALARRLAPDRDARQQAARQRYAELNAALERLLENWRQQTRADERPDAPADADGLAAIALMETARRFASVGRHEDATYTLAAAEGHVLALMRRVLGSRELDYTQRAGTPAEAFQIELGRHQALADLVPLALHDLKPGPEVTAQVERHVQAGKGLLARAIEQHAAGQPADGLATLRSATLYLQRALATAGVPLPTDPSIRPAP